MQALVLFASIIAVTSAGVVSLVPVSYVAEEVPVTNLVQNTHEGSYGYSYAGGPSAKEEVKGVDGAVRGAYSYIDANGIVQSAQYIADDAGFRIAATNVPTDAQVGVNVPYETPEVQAAKAAHFAEHAKAIAALGRKKRSLSYAAFPTAVSNQYHNQEHESIKIETPVYQQYAAQVPLTYAAESYVPVAPATYAVSSVPTSVSHQSRLQVHNSQNVEISAPVAVHAEPVAVHAEPVAVEAVRAAPVAVHAAPVAVSSLPTAVSSQRRFQVHNSNRIEVHSPIYSGVHVQPAAAAFPEAPVAVESPVELDSVAVEAVRTAPVQVAAPVAVSSVPTAVSSQSRSQVHSSTKVEVQAPTAYVQAPVVDSYGYEVQNEIVDAPSAYAASVAVHAAPVHAVHAVPTAVSSQSRSQVHSSQKVEVAAPVYASEHHVGLHYAPQLPLDTPEVAAAKQAHAEAYAAELVKHQGW
ncbi:signaling mucin HKR1 [Cephus cinctus]|uniref:Signaling mucin HKR1 n=1 Tax=Cephus cinctus TaxID=211228 RepID=A0AAJ7FR59_CEPCN|nr:signaling mucin HKR1 [Cephus cinctus]